jgi:hypothetical protein
MANGKKLTAVDARIYEKTGEVPPEFQDAAPHELTETLDFGMFAHEIKTYSSIPPVLQFILETEMEKDSTGQHGWSEARRAAYFSHFAEARPATEQEPVTAMFTAEQKQAGEEEERAASRPAVPEGEAPAAPLEMPEKIDWSQHSFDGLCSKSPDYFCGGMQPDPHLKAALSKLRGKSRPGGWDSLLASRLDLHFYEQESCADGTFTVAVYFRSRPQAYVALLFQAGQLFKFFFLRSIAGRQ